MMHLPCGASRIRGSRDGMAMHRIAGPSRIGHRMNVDGAWACHAMGMDPSP